MDITQEQRTVYTNLNGQFVACVDSGTIYQINTFTGQRVPVGVVQNVFDDLKGIADKYYAKLIEAGILQEPKTPEQMIAEQQQVMSDMLSVIKDLKREVEVLKNGRTENNASIEREPSNA